MSFESISVPNHQRLNGPTGQALHSLHKLRPIYNLANLLTTARFVVHGDSMQPSFSRGQYILVSRLAYLYHRPSRGDVVVLQHPHQRHKSYIKRIVGLPGERVRVQGERVSIDSLLLQEPYLDKPPYDLSPHDKNAAFEGIASVDAQEERDDPGKEWAVGDGEYFLMGDNRANSADSRSLGPLREELIIGKAWIRYWPRSAWGFLR